MHRKRFPLALLPFPFFFLLTTISAHDPPGSKVTWNGDVARIVTARCVRCHTPDGKGPMSLETYEDARPWAKAIREEVLARRMPKWHAARGYGQFANDRTLSPFEIALIVAWIDGGSVRGTGPLQIDGTPPPQPVPRSNTRTVSLKCGSRRMPAGRLLALTPQLEEESSAGFTLVFPDGRREIVAWIRNFEREFEETYWLQTPRDLPPGTRLATEADGECSVSLTMAR
jgi:mono/diheme cytochrome c family protein